MTRMTLTFLFMALMASPVLASDFNMVSDEICRQIKEEFNRKEVAYQLCSERATGFIQKYGMTNNPADLFNTAGIFISVCYDLSQMVDTPYGSKMMLTNSMEVLSMRLDNREKCSKAAVTSLERLAAGSATNVSFQKPSTLEYWRFLKQIRSNSAF